MSKPEDLEEGIGSPKSALNQSVKSQTQKISIIKAINDARGRLMGKLDEFNTLAIEDDVNEERDPIQDSDIEKRIKLYKN